MDENAAFKYWLHNIPGMGNKKIHKVLEVIPDPKMIYDLGPDVVEEFLGESKKNQKGSLYYDHWNKWNIEEEYQKLLDEGIQFLAEDMKGYPKALIHIPDKPYGIYTKGIHPSEKQPIVAVIGARNCSEYGKYMAREFGKQLAYAGMCVISGMAKGIDGIAQKEAIECGGKSIAVLGNGVDICYPPENRYLYDKLVESGTILSEYAPKTQPMPRLFPPRNRIISGMCDALVVIEAREKSGTLITVDMALEQGKDVYALPGRVTDSLSYGVNRLIKQGAGIIVSPDEFVAELKNQWSGKWEAQNSKQTVHEERKEGFSDELQKRYAMQEHLSEKERLVFHQLSLDPLSVEKIWEKIMEFTNTNLSLPELMEVLIKLCMKGYARQVRGGYGLSI